MPYHCAKILGWTLLTLSLAAAGETWQGQLQGGGQVQVDPVTRKPVYRDQGISVPLWDGVHQLDTGGVVIVRDGVAVPNEGMYGAWARDPAQNAGHEQVPVCDRLVRKVCGFHNECFSGKPCTLALQLKRLDQEESGRVPYGHLTGATQGCQQGMADPALFPACERIAEGELTRCGRLVVQVCGAGGGCNDTPACGSARQLEGLERDERLQLRDPHAATETGRQCEEAARKDYFAACKT